MRRRSHRHFFVAIAAVVLLFGVAPAPLAAPITVPTGLNSGDQYRLAFVTTTKRDATSSDIADYNTFVTAAADSVPELLALGTSWTAIGSTSAVAARDNTNTNPAVSGGVPVYLLNDTLVAPYRESRAAIGQTSTSTADEATAAPRASTTFRSTFDARRWYSFLPEAPAMPQTAIVRYPSDVIRGLGEAALVLGPLNSR